MAENNPHPSQRSQQASLPRIYSPDLQPLLQSLLGTLADIDFEYERECDHLNGRTMDMNLKRRLLEKLKQHHHQRREPYLQQLALLQERIRRMC